MFFFVKYKSYIHILTFEGESNLGKKTKEFRDPIYNFIHINDYEKKIIESPFFQRLRFIHQLGMTYYVYPGAQHTRFDHSLGTMEIATRLFDVLEKKKFKNKYIINSVFGKKIKEKKKYRQMLRIACLLHDIGHYPFSHAAESIWSMNHEERSSEIVTQSKMKDIIEDNCPKDFDISAKEIALIINDEKEIHDARLELLRRIITKDLGVDRIDYLIRDSLHTGVKYGLFDCHRLIDTFCLCEDEDGNPELCLEKGGIHAAEGLIYARYWIFLQVYFHKTRVAYDLHLGDYTKKYIEYCKKRKNDKIDYTKLNNFLKLNDFILLNRIYNDSKKNYNGKRFRMAKILMNRNHYKMAIEIDGSRINKKKIQRILSPREITEAVYHHPLWEEIEDNYSNELRDGLIIKKHSKTNPTKFPKDKFLICDKNDDLSNILDESKLIDSLKSIDLFRVFVDRDQKKLIDDIKKKGDSFKRDYYEERYGC